MNISNMKITSKDKIEFLVVQHHHTEKEASAIVKDIPFNPTIILGTCRFVLNKYADDVK